MTAARSPGTRAGFRRRYAAALAAHLAGPTEATLNEAYELGREAVTSDLTILDIAGIHHTVLAEDVVGGALHALEEALTAGDFLVESLSAFEMVRRGYREAREQTALERRQATLLRRLSSLLSDDSLAELTRASFVEALQLVAEQARELTGASACVLRTDATAFGVALETASTDENEIAGAGQGDPQRLVVALRSLDGSRLGSLEIVPADGTEVSVRDEQLLMQIAEMASAAIERIQLYRSRRPRLHG